MLKEFSGGIELTGNWARSILKSMNWTPGKVEPSREFLEEEKFTFQRKIFSVILDHDIPSEVVHNIDQTLLSYVYPGEYTFSLKGQKMFPSKV